MELLNCHSDKYTPSILIPVVENVGNGMFVCFLLFRSLQFWCNCHCYLNFIWGYVLALLFLKRYILSRFMTLVISVSTLYLFFSKAFSYTNPYRICNNSPNILLGNIKPIPSTMHKNPQTVFSNSFASLLWVIVWNVLHVYKI